MVEYIEIRLGISGEPIARTKGIELGAGQTHKAYVSGLNCGCKKDECFVCNVFKAVSEYAHGVAHA